MKTSRPITVRLPIGQAELLDVVAKGSGLNRSTLVRDAILRELNAVVKTGAEAREHTVF